MFLTTFLTFAIEVKDGETPSGTICLSMTSFSRQEELPMAKDTIGPYTLPVWMISKKEILDAEELREK